MARLDMNRYTCINEDCKYTVLTADVDSGTTPMFIRCPECGDRAMSHGYPKDIPMTSEVYGYWYRPKNIKGLTPEELEHVRNGGLLLRIPGQ